MARGALPTRAENVAQNHSGLPWRHRHREQQEGQVGQIQEELPTLTQRHQPKGITEVCRWAGLRRGVRQGLDFRFELGLGLGLGLGVRG